MSEPNAPAGELVAADEQQAQHADGDPDSARDASGDPDSAPGASADPDSAPGASGDRDSAPGASADRDSAPGASADPDSAPGASGDPDSARDEAPEQVSWFEPVCRPDGQEAGALDDGHVSSAGPSGSNGWLNGASEHGSHQPEQWFLPTGRAGLRPESMTESWQDAEHGLDRPETSAEPPWAVDQASISHEVPPPWESGPWPGPGEARQEQLPEPPDISGQDAGSGQPAADAGNWQATAALATGILPVVVPGIVLGILGLRRATVTGTGRTWSLLGIALSAIWAIILIAYLVSGGRPVQACGSYQNHVNYPVSQVLRDLTSGAPEPVLAQDLHVAISQVNSAAAAAQQVTARDAMVSLTAGLQQALATARQSHSAASYALIHKQLMTDASAVDRACAS